MGFLPKKWLAKLWAVRDPGTNMAKGLDCDACHVARANGSDACWEHHVKHPRPHLYRAGHEVGWGSGLDGGSGDDRGDFPHRASATSIH